LETKTLFFFFKSSIDGLNTLLENAWRRIDVFSFFGG